ncbi:hypothetical protein D3C81_1372050 [compost metagenome]
MGLDYGQGQEEIDQFIHHFHSLELEVAIHTYSTRLGNSRYNPLDNDKVNVTENRKPCQWIYNELIILADGSVTTCYFDLAGKNIVDNLRNYDYSITELWQGKAYRKIRDEHEKRCFSGECKLCTDWSYYNVPDHPYVTIYPLVGEPFHV